MSNCPYQKLDDIDCEVVHTAISHLSEGAIRKMAIETPELYYKWCIETYTAQRKARLEADFQTALLEKLQRCDPRSHLQSVA